ncbi:FxSxx-COOH system tetratricopeptide repeat protein [Rhizomonospora bruguierae]|uniref:FxSxx-COOH system tetratricopeptide repeat protein n=1 Tax=Rhizomonospora bruguierae TaxID=1581705 RepID=UPI001BCEE06C|nr:FxSxx-COOH system tetratricopeptide repeat protein [Micromonospora sp. NBRC 107566]
MSWPQRVGDIPVLASAFQPRTGLRAHIGAARGDGGTVVLTQVLSGGGGVGKSQLVASYAVRAIAEGTDLVVWVNAARPEAIPAAFAQTAARVQAPGADGGDAEADARALLDWLATTDRSWLVVLDDLSDAAHVGAWWPASHTGTGWVLATTRRRDAAFSGGGRSMVDVDVYSADESAGYLAERLSGAGAAHLLDAGVGPLAEELGRLPLALSHAAAYMINENIGCTEYLALVTDRRSRLDAVLPPSADADGYRRPVAVTLLLAVDAAQACDPAGLALPALRLAAALDPAGHPDTLWTESAVTTYLSAHRTTDSPDPPPVTGAEARAAMRLLHRYGLATHDPRPGPRAARVHALTARAAREATPPAQWAAIAHAAADALLAAWPDPDTSPDLADLVAALRANTDTLTAHAGDLLWQPDGQPLLYRAGDSLLDAGLHDAATTHWQKLVASAERTLGPDHPATLSARARLAKAHRQADRLAEAITIQEGVATDRERVLGIEHPDTLRARDNLATSYWQIGRVGEAIALMERVVTDMERVLGPEDTDTLAAWTNLALSYGKVGRTAEAIAIQERVVTDAERIVGPDDIDALFARAILAAFYREVGRTAEAIVIEEQTVASAQRLLGPENPSTLIARANLAASYEQAGRVDDAIAVQERVAADSERLFGPESPKTLSDRSILATFYRNVGRTAEAITLFERVAADRERLFGPEHPETLTARGNLASSYQKAGRTTEATTIMERLVTDMERILGPEHPYTLTSRAILAACYEQAGRVDEAIAVQEQVVADRERILGTEHPETVAARSDLATSYQNTGRTSEAITIMERVVADRARIQGAEHPDATAAAAILREWRQDV